MKPLAAVQFTDFFQEIHGHSPFPWQTRLVRQVLSGTGAENGWPAVMALPTASGKTACIDIALFTLAAQADLSEKRTAPRRIFFVVDRRVIVDEAFERAKKIAQALQDSSNEVVRTVAERLELLAGAESVPNRRPLQCCLLRGGIYRDDAWAKSPAQPAVICSTVDQVGSRLLFRSYGCSRRMASVHAGLAGNDALILLDEAHCAKPFMETAQAIWNYRQWFPHDEPVETRNLPFHVVVMSATPPPEIKENPFQLNDDDFNNELLQKRITASKPAELVKVSKNKTEETFIEKAFAVAQENKAIAIIVNRVDTARKILHSLQDEKESILKKVQREAKKQNRSAIEDYDVELFIGRMRPIDRDETTRKWLDKLSVDKSSDRQLDKPVFIVATQCLEVGANLDFDALVTECASLDALRQRFGRVNRLGIREAATSYILIQEQDSKNKEQDLKNKEDPIYGNALSVTGNWLTRHADKGPIDMGIDALNALIDKESEHLESLMAPAKNAPVLLPAHIDCWVQTEPVPQPDPDVALFLHGPDAGIPEVQVCWRKDIPATLEDEKVKREEQQNNIIEAISLYPPVSSECMSVPIHIVRRWLKGQEKEIPLTDIEGLQVPADEKEQADSGQQRWLVRWLGPDESEVIDNPNAIRPGDTLVISEALGGWNRFGYIPKKKDGEPIDIAEQAYWNQKRPVFLRFHEDFADRFPEGELRSQFESISKYSEESEEDRDIQKEIQEFLRDLSHAELTEGWKWLSDMAQTIDDDKYFKLVPHPFGGWIYFSRKRVPIQEHKTFSTEHETFSTEDDTSSTSLYQRAIPLDMHCKQMEKWAEVLVKNSGLSKSVIQDLKIAARFHDIGKADPRFQAWLRNGNRMVAEAEGTFLAKSEGLPQSLESRRQARERSGYPKGSRHELLSVRLLESDFSLLERAHDPDLVLHLIASHHGYCRPFAPVVEDAEPVEVTVPFNGSELKASSATGLERLDSGVAERFWKLVRRYGWWGLAYLEAVLRLSDHRTSEWEQTIQDEPKENQES